MIYAAVRATLIAACWVKFTLAFVFLAMFVLQTPPFTTDNIRQTVSEVR